MKASDPFYPLKLSLDGDVFTDQVQKVIYATDASSYREIPAAVTRPKNKEDIKPKKPRVVKPKAEAKVEPEKPKPEVEKVEKKDEAEKPKEEVKAEPEKPKQGGRRRP